MMKPMHMLGMILSLVAQQTAVAGSVSGARITHVVAQEDAAFFVYVDKTITNPAACGTDTISNKRFAISVDTAAGRALIATVLASKASGSLIDIGGRGEFPGNFTNFCNVWSGTETINYLISHD